ncbi:MAG: radical SAM protein [Hungatella sp.]|nr:radical SAM protein [Hungatella sp.]
MNKNETPYSNLKIFHHQDILSKLEKGERCNPLYIRIKPTNICNQNCYYCHYKNSYLDLDEYNPKDYIPYNKMMEIIEDMGKMGVKAVTFSGGGEPLAYPYIEETMKRVLENNIDLSIITNGSMLTGNKAEILSKAKWVRISVDSIIPEHYARIRGISQNAMEILQKNIKEFSMIKNDNCELGINFVIGKENYKEIRDVATTMRELGVNHVKFAPLISNETEDYHQDIKDEVIDTLKNLSEELNSERFKIIDLYTSDFGDYEVFKRIYSCCPMKEFICIIAANSKVYYCQDKAYLSDGCVCDLSQQSFFEAWNSKLVTQKFKEFDARKICKQHCVHDSRNILINSFLNMDRNHVNFV